MATSDSILTAITAAVKTIRISGGYKTDLDPANVFSRLTPLDSLQRNQASSYPRVFVISEGASYSDLPGRRVVKEEQFTVIAVFAQNKENPVDVPLTTQAANFVDDFERWMDLNRQTGGSDLLRLLTCSTDAETPGTEAIAMFEIAVTYKRSFN